MDEDALIPAAGEEELSATVGRAEKIMTNREIILGRIREALKIAAPHPAFGEDAPSPLPASPQQWLPPVGQILEQQIELFQKNVEDLKAGFRVCASLSEAAQHVKNLAAAGGWEKIGRHSGELTDAVARDLGLPEVLTDHGYAVNDLESCDAGLTGCEALVAQTGSVLVSAPSAGGRALSVLPPHHIVLARRSQVVPDLSVALQRMQEKFKDKFPSFLSFISGPSRTGDIERILVLGAHGPKKLTILLLP
jgi:L-lactate dehydrogenase complex protein LldG